MKSLKREVLPVFAPLLKPARYKGAWGGRGSGKSHFFAEQMLVDHMEEPGLLSLCVRETQRSLAQSSKRLLENKIGQLRLGYAFKIWHDRIEAPGDGVVIFQGMQSHNSETVKSFDGFKRCWVEEAQAFSDRSLSLLRPTIRASGSQIWASWNPRRKSDAIDVFMRQGVLPDSIVKKASWRDNKWFTNELEAERQLDLMRYPERYDHVWEGGYAKAFEGAYYARQLAEAKASRRIGRVSRDPLLPVRAFCDIGGSGNNADAFSIWIVQWVGRSILVLDYIEGQGQVLGYYAQLLRDRGWGDCIVYLPHDGVNENNVTGKRYEDHWRDAGFNVEPPIKNQGKGAALMRIEAARRLFPSIWFSEEETEAGRDALGFYHEKRDEERNVGLGPDHDWSSHAADAFGLMCVAYEEPSNQPNTLIIPDFGAV